MLAPVRDPEGERQRKGEPRHPVDQEHGAVEAHLTPAGEVAAREVAPGERQDRADHDPDEQGVATEEVVFERAEEQQRNRR